MARRKKPLGLWLVYITWFVVLFDPEWFLAAHGPSAVLKVPLFLFGLVAAFSLARARPGMWFPPLLAMVLLALAALPFAPNPAFALRGTKQLVLYYILAVGTLAYVRRPSEAAPIVVMMFIYQYVWWGVLGAKNGLVTWDVTYNNNDSYGPLMVMGITSAAYFGLATKSKALRRVSFATAALCLVGLVSSFARGAVMAGVLVMLFAWIRSPRKGAATLGIVAAIVIVGTAGTLWFSNVYRGSDTNPNFFKEMLSINGAVTQGKGEGTDRTVLWKIAWQEFLDQPVFGVGIDCYGVYAASHFRPGEVAGPYADNPAKLYERAVHNTYFQILAERGTVGALVFLWLVIDFWRRNARMKATRFVKRWGESGGAFDLRALAIALETAMVGFLSTGLFYNELNVNWLFALVTVNVLLYSLSAGATSSRTSTRSMRLASRSSQPHGPGLAPHPEVHL